MGGPTPTSQIPGSVDSKYGPPIWAPTFFFFVWLGLRSMGPCFRIWPEMAVPGSQINYGPRRRAHGLDWSPGSSGLPWRPRKSWPRSAGRSGVSRGRWVQKGPWGPLPPRNFLRAQNTLTGSELWTPMLNNLGARRITNIVAPSS